MSGEYFVSKAISLGFYSGATVEITSVPVSCEGAGGWENWVDPSMENCIGHQFVVDYVADDGITGPETDFYWPWWTLKLVKKSPNPTPNDYPTDAYGPYMVGGTAYVDGDKGKILGFDHEKNLIHLDLGDSETYWFNYYDVSESVTPVSVKLNDEYNASIDFDSKKIVVGCQEIPFDAVFQLANTIKAGK